MVDSTKVLRSVCSGLYVERQSLYFVVTGVEEVSASKTVLPNLFFVSLADISMVVVSRN